MAIGAYNKLHPGNPLVFLHSLVPLGPRGLVHGGGVMHHAYAETLGKNGYDVVVIEATNVVDKRPGIHYQRFPILFTADAAAQDLYRRHGVQPNSTFTPHADFNFPVFTSYPASTERFVNLPDDKLARYIPLWQWAIRAAAVVYGVPDVVWNGHAWIMNAITARTVPTALTAHGTCLAPNLGLMETRLRAINRFGIESVSAAFAVSRQERRRLLSPHHFAVSPERVHVVPNGYDPTAFHTNDEVTRTGLQNQFPKLHNAPTGAPWVVFAGRPMHEKGVDLLFEAVARLQRERSKNAKPIHLVIAGSDGKEPVPFFDELAGAEDPGRNYREQANEHGLAGHTHFLGRVSQTDMAHLVRLADAYVLPARMEGFGLVAIEGMAVGQPPVVARTGGFVDIVKAYAGERTDISRFMHPDDPFSAGALKATLEVYDDQAAEVGDDCQRAAKDLLLAAIESSEPRTVITEFRDSPHGQYLLQLLLRISRTRAVDSLVEALRLDLAQNDTERERRGQLARAYATTKWPVETIITEQNIPVLRNIMGSISTAAWVESDSDGRFAQSPQRTERLDQLRTSQQDNTDSALHRRFEDLKSQLNTDDVAQTGRASRAFFASMSHFLGSTARFAHPFSVDAYGFENPNAILHEIAAILGVSFECVFDVMQRTSALPPAVLAWQI